MPVAAPDAFRYIAFEEGRGNGSLAGVSEEIAPGACGHDVVSSISSSVAARGQMFCCALQTSSLTFGNCKALAELILLSESPHGTSAVVAAALLRFKGAFAVFLDSVFHALSSFNGLKSLVAPLGVTKPVDS